MPANKPQNNEDRYEKIEEAFKTLAPAATFGGMTLVQFQTAIQPSIAARAEVARLEDELKAALVARDNADLETLKDCDLVVKGVVGDPNFGDDSALYEAMGYIRKSDRKSGLTRKKADAKV
ncbi:MAG TPA: hypothetical protein VF627_06015 [Abditibacterium sp.]